MSSKARLRDYDGTTPVAEWIRHFLLVAEANRTSWTNQSLKDEEKEGSYNQRCISEIQLHLTGSLVIWLDTLSDGDKKEHKALLELLKQHILGEEDEDWSSKANELKRDDFKSMQEYKVHKLQALNKAFPPGIKEMGKVRLDMFIKGLPKDVGDWVKTEDATKRDSIDKITLLAIGYEKALANQRAENAEIVNAKLQGSPNPQNSSAQSLCWKCKMTTHDSPADSRCVGHLDYLRDIHNIQAQNTHPQDLGEESEVAKTNRETFNIEIFKIHQIP